MTSILGILLGIRAFDGLIIGFILIAFIYLGSLFLIIDIPIFNRVNIESVYIMVLSIFLGLAFGLLMGNWYTREQLKILSIKNEFRGLGLSRIYIALFLGLALFLACSFFVFYFRIPILGLGLSEFVVSGAFTMYISRIVLIQKWEKKSGKMIMAEWNRLYAVPNPLEKPA